MIDIDFKGTHEGTARGMDAAPAGRRITARLGGKLRSFTPATLIKGVSLAMRPVMQARQQRAYDQGLQIAKSRNADNAIAAALLQSNRSSQQLNARAIDQLFDTPAPAGANNLPLLDVLDGIVPEQPQSLDDVLDGIQKHTGPALSLDQAIDDVAPQPRVSITKFINDL